MVKRRAPEEKNKASENDDLDFAMSQESNGTDEQLALIQTVKNHYAAAMEKKKSQQEKKFLDVAKKQLNQEVAASTKDVRDSMKAIEDLYSAFLNDYAACENRIYKKLVQLQKEQEKLMKMVEARYKKDQETIKDASALHIAGLSKTRTACKEYQAVIDRLIFRAQEEDDEA